MITLKNVLDELKSEFKNAAIDTFSLDAQLIITEVLGITRVKLLTYPDMEISSEEYNKIREYADLRLKNMPMQYILGHCEFMGIDFNVNESTLIPRGDTELLVEEAIATIKNSGYNSVLDIGTGSGAIAISIAKYTDAKVTAVDISKEALTVATENANKNNVNVNFIESDLFENVEGVFDIIVSNPPYIETNVIETLEPQVKDFEPFSALNGGEDGLYFYRKIVEKCHKFLKPKGYIMFEIGYNQGEALKAILENADFTNIAIKKDLAGLDRLVIGCKI